MDQGRLQLLQEGLTDHLQTLTHNKLTQHVPKSWLLVRSQTWRFSDGLSSPDRTSSGAWAQTRAPQQGLWEPDCFWVTSALQPPACEPPHLSALQRRRLLANSLQSNVELALQNQLPVVFNHVSLQEHGHGHVEVAEGVEGDVGGAEGGAYLPDDDDVEIKLITLFNNGGNVTCALLSSSAGLIPAAGRGHAHLLLRP